MLKKFIQLFAEKFLISKRVWVSTQRNIDSSKTVELSLPNNTELHSYLPPSNGMLVLGQSNSSGYAYLEVTASGAKFNLDQNQTNVYYQAFSVPVNKGELVTYKATADNRSQFVVLRFIPFVGES